MDLINKTNSAQIHAFYKQNAQNFYLSRHSFEICDKGYRRYEKIQNFSSVYLKLCLLDQKHITGTFLYIGSDLLAVNLLLV